MAKKQIVTKGNKRHAKKSAATELPRASIRRLCYRAGVKRISGSIYPEVRAIAKILAEAVIARTVPITKYNNKKTVSVRHVKEALDSIGIRLYGCEN